MGSATNEANVPTLALVVVAVARVESDVDIRRLLLGCWPLPFLQVSTGGGGADPREEGWAGRGGEGDLSGGGRLRRARWGGVRFPGKYQSRFSVDFAIPLIH